MPSSPRRGKKRADQRCVYVETIGGTRRRCVRNATTAAGLCRTHVVVYQDLGSTPKSTGQVVGALIDDFMSGNKVSKSRLAEAASQLFGAWAMGGGMAGGYYPPTGPPAQGGSPWQGIPGWPFGGQAGAQQQRRPPPNPMDEILAARARARVVLGYAASEPVSKEQIQQRRRELAKRHHPDKPGGSVNKMQEVNAAADILLAELEGDA